MAGGPFGQAWTWGGRGAGSIHSFRNAPVTGTTDGKWSHGSRSPRHLGDPPLQVVAHAEHRFLLRGSKGVSSEAPFLYLFFGNRRAIVADASPTAESQPGTPQPQAFCSRTMGGPE